MVVCIMQRGGSCWYTTVDATQPAEAVEFVKGIIDRGETLRIWWFSPYGQRYTESIWLDSSEIAFIRTESDDG